MCPAPILRGRLRATTIDIGVVSINEYEAAVVRKIFSDYLRGLGSGQISRALEAEGVPSARGGKWTYKQILSILKNEKYTGNALLQKKFVVDHISKRKVTNKGAVPKYYAEDTHPAIIDMDTFNMVQSLIEAKHKKDQTPRELRPFSGLMTCGLCGRHYRRRMASGKPVWICANLKEYGKSVCHSKQIPEETLYALACEALGLNVFDEDVFKENIVAIHIPSSNKVVFTFADGHEVETEWQYSSRSEGWTDEMRKQAQEHARRTVE